MQHVCSATSRIGVAVHKAYEFAETVLGNNGIRIEQEHIFTLALPYRKIVGACKTKVLLTCNEIDSRKAFLYILNRAVT